MSSGSITSFPAQGNVTEFRTSWFAPSQNPLGENAQEWAARVLPHFPEQNLIGALLTLIPLIGIRYGRVFLLKAAFSERISKADLESLYVAQLDEVFGGQQLVTLEFLASVLNSNRSPLFSFEEIISIEEARHSSTQESMRYMPCLSDVSFILFERERLHKVPTKTLQRWSEATHVQNMDMHAVIDTELVRRKELKMSQAEVGHRLFLATRENPTGNATKVYLTLLLKRSKRKGSVREEILKVLIDLLCPALVSGRVDFTTARSIFGFYVNNPLIPEEDRDWLISEVRRNCVEFANHYLRFVDHARASDPFKLTR